MLKAIVLDIDGVVTNLDIFQYISWKSVFSQLGLNLTPKIWSRFVHKPRKVIAAGIAHDLRFKVNPTQIDEICTKKDLLFQSLIRNGLTPKNINDGIKQLILDARKHGLKVACASLSSNARLELECLGLIKLFDYITDYKNHEHDSYFTDAKKTVSTTMLILQNLKLNGHEIIGFEDDAAGIDDYNRHSVYSVAITHFNPKVGIDAKFQVNLPQQLNLEEIIFNYYQKDDTDN